MTPLEKHSWRRLLPLLMMICLLMPEATATPLTGPDNNITVIALGSKDIKNSGGGSAKQAAIKDGQHRAIAAALEAVVPVDVLTENFDEIIALPFDHPERFISNYEVLAVSEGPGACRVLVRVSVSTLPLTNAIKSAGILIDREHPPVVLALISEKLPDQPLAISATVTEQVLMESFSSKGITIIVPDSRFTDNVRFPRDVPIISGAETHPKRLDDISDPQAISLAQEKNADFIIIGRSEIIRQSEVERPAGDTRGNGPLSLTLSARLLDVKTGDILSRITEPVKPEQTVQPDDDTNKILEVAGKTIARKLSPPIVAAWDSRTDASQPITITIQGPGDIAKLETFRKSLQTIHKVKNVQGFEMSMKQAVITVNFTGSAEHLASAISSYSPEDLHVKIISVSKSNIQMRLGSRTTSW